MKVFTFLSLLFQIISLYHIDLYSQTSNLPKVEIMSLKLEKVSELAYIQSLEFDLKFSALKEKFISAKEVKNTKLTDESGQDLIKLSKEILKKKESEGFSTSRQQGWKFYKYNEDTLEKAFRANFINFALPASGSNYIDISSVISITIAKPGKIKEKTIKGIDIKAGTSLTIENKTISFSDYGSSTFDDGKTYFILKVESDLAIVEILVLDLKLPEGMTLHPDEVIIPDNNKKRDIIIKYTDTETIEVPLKMKILIGI